MILFLAVMVWTDKFSQAQTSSCTSSVHEPGVIAQTCHESGYSEQWFLQIAQASNPREQFINAYRRYREEFEIRLIELNLKDWAASELSKIQEQVETARAQFQTGDYQAAYLSINQAIMDVDAVSLEYKSRLANFIDNANRAYQEGKYLEAGQQISEGLQLDPENAELVELESRIQRIDRVNQLLIEANQAKVMNQESQELAILEKILLIDPQHLEAKQRIRERTVERLHRAYTDAIAEADRALDEKNIEQAKKHMQAANKLKPGNQDVKRMRNRIVEIETEQEYLQQISLAITSIVEDNWYSTVEHYEQALKVKPHDEFATEGLSEAKAMIERIQSLKQLLQYERRLVNERAIETAKILLSNTEPFLDQSDQLRDLHDEIIAKLQIYSVETEVLVTSDGETNVSVKGVGIVGRVSSHSIRLKPGDYQFEGTRDGFRSVIVPVSITPGGGPVQVEVICRERI